MSAYWTFINQEMIKTQIKEIKKIITKDLQLIETS